MNIAFYAPMKPADSPIPSGDRQMARAIIGVLETLGHDVRIASSFRSWSKAGGDDKMQRLSKLAAEEADRVLAEWSAEGWKPDMILTYHVYHKAPDWLGPRLSRALGIPYVIVEGARALKQQGGPWSVGFAAADDAFRAAGIVAAVTTEDIEGLRPVVPAERLRLLLPFIETDRFRRAGERRAPSDVPRLLAAGMMRDGDKRASYRVLADALDIVGERNWRLAIAGDGPAADEIRTWFAAGRTTFLGEVAPQDMPSVYADADIFVWPAVNEAYGLVLIEAQASGLPVIAGASGGVPDIVDDGVTGHLCPEGDAMAFAAALDRLLGDPETVAEFGKAAAIHAERHLDTAIAGRRLREILRKAQAVRAERRSGARS